MTTLVLAIVIQAATLVVLVGWAIRKDRRLRRDGAAVVQED
jgi:hypothetical protein